MLIAIFFFSPFHHLVQSRYTQCILDEFFNSFNSFSMFQGRLMYSIIINHLYISFTLFMEPWRKEYRLSVGARVAQKDDNYFYWLLISSSLSSSILWYFKLEYFPRNQFVVEHHALFFVDNIIPIEAKIPLNIL